MSKDQSSEKIYSDNPLENVFGSGIRILMGISSLLAFGFLQAGCDTTSQYESYLSYAKNLSHESFSTLIGDWNITQITCQGFSVLKNTEEAMISIKTDNSGAFIYKSSPFCTLTFPLTLKSSEKEITLTQNGPPTFIPGGCNTYSQLNMPPIEGSYARVKQTLTIRGNNPAGFCENKNIPAIITLQFQNKRFQ